MGVVTWTPKARDDLDRAARYIAGDSPRMSEVFRARVLEAVARLEPFPRIGRIVPNLKRDDLREIFVYNYRIVYQLVGDDARVVGVRHGARRMRRDDLF